MTPFYADDWLTVLGGDCRAILAELEADSVDCVVTSPPYWNLRDYGTATWTGGEPDHQHVGSRQLAPPPGSPKQASKRGSTDVYAGDCACGAVRVDQQIGLEHTPDEYVETMVEVFRTVRRVLKPSGTLWLNLGDSYIDRANASQGALHRKRRDKQMPPRLAPRPPGLKDKDLAGVPFRVVLALQSDGWWWRQTIVWSKPNPMPESVSDRPTTSHEYLFLLTKSARYYFDADAVREENASLDLAGSEHLRKDWRERPGNGEWPSGTGGRMGSVTSGRNIRSVWTIATRPYHGAHFAVFPPEIPRRCILAGSPEGGLVLDPFGGSGTVGMVAQQLRRRAVLIDLNPEYLEQQLERAAREWGRGGKRLVDRAVEPPDDSLWTLAQQEASA